MSPAGVVEQRDHRQREARAGAAQHGGQGLDATGGRDQRKDLRRFEPIHDTRPRDDDEPTWQPAPPTGEPQHTPVRRCMAAVKSYAGGVARR
jgi:hypothetical protein